MARLILEHNKQVLKDFPFRKGSITIGRNKGNTIVIDSPEVSGYHARIDRKNDEYILTDLQSTNGSFVNGLDVVSHKLTHGDKISFGKHVFLFVGTVREKADGQRKRPDFNQTMIFDRSKKRRIPFKRQTVRKNISVQKVERPSFFRKFALIYLAIFVVTLGGVSMLGEKQAFTEWISIFKASSTRNQHESRIVDSTTLETEATSAGGTAVRITVPAKPTSQQPAIAAEPALDKNDLLANRSEEDSQSLPAESTEEFRNAEVGYSKRYDVSGLKVEGIMWANNPKYSSAVINGLVVRLGRSVEGLTVTEIGRGYVVLQSSETDSKIRLVLR
ncbi:MAG: FHA domain-containing protein [Deltaproteobacteria bacterium]|jgi:hypothetical protein